MNSYTSTSNQSKVKITIFILAFIVSIVVVDVALEFYAAKKTTKISYIMEKDSKLKHAQNVNPINKQAIFIGSSRTYYHVSTNETHSNQLYIYNMGVSNSSLQDYPAFVQAAIDYKPRSIILSIEVNELFRELPLADYPQFIDLNAYYHSLNLRYLLASVGNWVMNFHSLLRYSESIYLKITSFYKTFTPKITETTLNNTAVNKLKSVSDCDIFSKKQTDYFITAKCKNGDGILFGNYTEAPNDNKIKLQKINLETIAFLNHLIAVINSENIIPIVILEPVNQFNIQYQYDFKLIKSSMNAQVMDLTQLQLPLTYWVDSRHLNNQGRLFYSRYISSILKNTINE